MNRAYVVITTKGFILGVYADEKTAHFYCRMHTVHTGEAARVSAEPIITKVESRSVA